LRRAPAADSVLGATMPVTTRSASPGDIPTLIGMMREFYAEADYALDADWAASSFGALLADPSRGAVWIGAADGEPAGYAVATFRHSMEFGGTDAFIDDLFVHPRFRRRGVGKAVLSEAFRACQERGVLAIHVETSADNAGAVALYGGLGMLDRGRLLLTRRLTSRDETMLAAKRA
jgi:ribosomal protein S18 acetylase RimI-like enzyme